MVFENTGYSPGQQWKLLNSYELMLGEVKATSVLVRDSWKSHRCEEILRPHLQLCEIRGKSHRCWKKSIRGNPEGCTPWDKH